MHFRHPQPRKTRRPSNNSDSDIDLSDGEDIPESVMGPIEIPKSPSHPSSSRIGSTPGMRAPTHIDFSSSPHSPRSLNANGSLSTSHKQLPGEPKWPQQLYKQWFGAIVEGRSIQVHSILADHPEVLNMRRREPTPFHMALTHIASEWLGNDTTGMDGLQVAIMGYKNAYANWRLGNGSQTEHMAGMSADQMKEHVAVREVILGALIDAISPEQLDSHFFGRQQNTTLHLAAFYNDANLVERLLRQGAAVDIANRMGFLPTGITNDKPTLQWLSMYRAQVRGSRYSLSQLQAQSYTPESDNTLDQFGDSRSGSPGAYGSPMSVPQDTNAHAADAELEALDHFSDDEVSESSYIKQFADSPRSLREAQRRIEDNEDAVSDEEQADDVSVVSSNDRCSLGLGGSRPNLAKRSLDGPNLRKRALEGSKRSDAGESHVSNGSFSSETAHLSPASTSTPASVTSYHTANGTFSDDPDTPQSAEFNRDASVRIKVDPNTLHDSLYDDIFSDEDDGVVQMEPSFCHSGAGLSDTNQLPASEKPQQPIVSSAESIDMQSLSNAMAQTKLSDAPVASQPAISAFPVMISNVPSQPIVNSTSKSARAVEQLKQETNDTKGGQPARASSPFMLRDSLYEMIMGRSNSRSSMSSIGSVNSNALSNTSTVNVSKEQQQQQQQQQQASQPRSPTSPTSHTSHVSPTSTTFDESNASASQTAISSPTENTSFNTVMKSSAAQVPEAVPEEEAEPVSSLPPRPMLNPEDYSDSEGSSCSTSDDSLRGSHQNVGFDSHSSSAEAVSRPTAASLFGIEHEDVPEEPVTAYATAETSPAVAESAEQAISIQSAPSFHAGRIGRRLGRETVDLMLDEDTSSSVEKFDIMSTKKPEPADLPATPDEPTLKASEEASPLEVAKLPSDVPLTREKRDQYLQTLISRNTMRGASPNKRSAMALAMRAASPAPAGDAASSAGEDDSDWHSPSRTQTFRQRHLSKRSESGIDFAGTRSPSSMGGLRDRVWDPESLPRPSSSQHIREALSVSGASINGRMRANTINDANSPEAEISAAAARKVSPSLSSLKTRNLVSNSPAKSLESHNPLPKWSPSQHLKQSESRTRAMSTPVDAQPPSLRLESSATEGSTMRASASTARIGRVAALSQNFERQQDQSIPRVVIPMRTGAYHDPTEKSGAVSAPLNKLKNHYQRPATRSSSISSAHSSGGHGQTTVANSGGKDKGSGGAPSDNAPVSKDNAEPPAEDSNAGDDDGGSGGGHGGAGNSGGNHGDDDSSSNGKPSPNPRAAQILESNDSSSSGTSTGRGLAANIRGDSLTHFIDSSSSGDIGSSIFSSDSRTSSINSGKNPLSASEPTRLHTKSRRETEAERKRRFRELAKRRKSGTLEKISNSGLVKNRKALFVPSEPAIGEATESMPQLQTHHRGRSRDTSSSSDNNAGSFLGNRGEASRPPDAPAGNDAMPSSLSSVDVDLERLQQANTSALHPSYSSAGKAPLTRESSVRGGLDTDAMLERTLAQAHEEAVEAVNKQEQPTGTVWSRGSGSDKSRGESNSGDDSLHILSSLDTNSTPGSTPIDSAPDNTKVGLLAQYDMNQRRIDRRLKRLSEQGYAIAASNEPDPSQTDANPDDDAADDSIVSSDDDAADQTEQSGFDTMMPSRPRTNPQAVFGLSVVAEEDEENRNASHVSDAQPSTDVQSPADEMRASTYNSLRGLRAALGPHMVVAPIYRGLGSVSIPEATAQDPVSPQDVGITQEALDAALSSPRADAEESQHSFDPYVVFGYTSEENSTMASRSSLERSSDLFSQRPGSSASRVMYMRPLDTPEPESVEASTSRIVGRRTAESNSPALSRPSSEFGSASRMQFRRLPEMQQVVNPMDSLPHAPVPTLEELDADASSEEEPIPKLLFVESQEFDGYVPIGRQIQQEREERRQRRRRYREAAKRGEKLPVEEEEEEEMISPLWFEDNPFLEPLPPHLQRMMEAKRDQILARKMSRSGAGERSELKRHLETATISSRRLHSELLATSTTGSTSRGTIKQLAKRARTTDIADMFSPPPEESDDESLRHKSARKEEQRKSFLDSVEIPISELSESAESVPYVEQTDPREMAYISQEFQVPGQGKYKTPEFDADLFMGTPRKRLVLRAQPRTFSERVLSEVNELDVTVNTDVQGSVRMRSAGQFAYEPAGTVRPTTIPQYVSPLNGVPAGPFFMPPKAAAKAGYLYMRILSIDDMEEPPSSVYFVIRNGIDTLATTPVPVGGVTTSTINQEFRILTDPEVSITMWMRFRSEAIISRESRSGPLARAYGDSSCMPPLLRRLVRRNTRTRNTWQCASPADSVFDFAAAQPRFDAGARRAGPLPRADAFPERVSSAHMRNQFQRQQHMAEESDPRSLNATQAPSSVFYEPGGNAGEARKGLAEAQFREETRGVAVVHVGEMLDEVFLRGLVDSWDVENVWENRKGARLALQLFFIPECPLFREEELPKTLSECEMAMEVCAFHNRTLNSGFMSQRGGDTRFWRRRYFRLIGGFLFAYHEETKEPRCFIDLNDAQRVVDLHTPHHAEMSSTPPQLRGLDLMRSQRMRRRPTHKRNNSDHSSRDGGAAQTLDRGTRNMAPGHSYASDSEPADLVDIADPVLQRSSMRRRQRHQSAAAQTDSGVFSQASGDGAPDNGMQHSFSIEFKSGGLIEFYCESEQEKRVWVEIIKRVVGNIPKIPSWLIKLLHADVSERIDEGCLGSSEASMGSSVPSSKFQEMAHPHPHLQP